MSRLLLVLALTLGLGSHAWAQVTPGGGGGGGGVPTATGVIASSTASPTVQTAAYASGNDIGGLITLTGAVAVRGYIQNTSITMADSQTPTLDVFFFNANPTGSTITDKTNIAIATADLPKVIGIAHVSDCSSGSAPTICQAQNLAMPYQLASGTTYYIAIVARNAITPTVVVWNVAVGTVLQ
jgi:hypothetical protein